MFKKMTLFLSLLLWVQWVVAQIPDGYYDAATGTSGKSLKTALYRIIASHTERTYTDLWTDFKSTDKRADGKVWDMYSAITNYDFDNDKAGNYGQEGDVYNREHSFPKSWFSDAKPMYTDLFHLYPTDGYVNGRRGNLPFGETDRPDWTSAQSWSKVGPSSMPGYSGKVFEPNDEYKGDFARSYFYMATCYEDKIATWSSPMLARNSYPAYTEWAVAMLLRWAEEDPVSEKEIARNNAVYKIQKNRNPYIDYPGLERLVWGDRMSETFDPDNYDPDGGTEPGPEPDEVLPPVFSPASGEVSAGTVVTISSETPGAYIYYTVNGGEEQIGFAPVKITVSSRTDISAYAMVGENRSETVEASYTIAQGPVTGSNVYVKISSAEELQLGYRYLIVCETKGVALSGAGDDIRQSVEVTPQGSQLTTETGATGLPYALTLGGSAAGYTLYDAVGRSYLGLTSNGNKLPSVASADADGARWTVTFQNGNARIANVKYNARSIQYNAQAPRFAAYESAQQPVCLYKETVEDRIEGIEAVSGRVDVFAPDGRLVRKGVEATKALRGLQRGIYIVGGVKVYVP